MILWLLNFFGGWYEITGDSAAAAAFLNLCMRGCYPYWYFRQDEDCFSFRVRRRVWRELSAACVSAGLGVCCQREGGLPRIARRYRRRWGMFAGLAVCIGLIWLSGRYVWRIEVDGTSQYQPRDVLEELEAQGFAVGSFIPDVDVNTLQNRILIASDRFAWISVNLIGTTARVEVVELTERQTAPRETAPANLVASADGQIVRLELRDGWAAIKVGDTVRSGELLVSGFGETKDARTVTAHAEGKVYAQVVHQISVEIPFAYEEKRYTGEKISEKRINFFGKVINLFGNTGILGGSCDTIDNERILSFFGRVSVPVSFCTTTHLAYVTEPAVRDEAAARALAEYALRQQTDALCADRELIRSATTTTVTDDGVRLDCTLWCVENIAQTQPITLGAPAEVSVP